MVIDTLYTSSNRFLQNRNDLSGEKYQWLRNIFGSTFSVLLHKAFGVNVRRMIKRNLLNFMLFKNLHDAKVCFFSLTSFGTEKYDYVMNTEEILNFLPLKTQWLLDGVFNYWSYQQSNTWMSQTSNGCQVFKTWLTILAFTFTLAICKVISQTW